MSVPPVLPPLEMDMPMPMPAIRPPQRVDISLPFCRASVWMISVGMSSGRNRRPTEARMIA